MAHDGSSLTSGNFIYFFTLAKLIIHTFSSILQKKYYCDLTGRWLSLKDRTIVDTSVAFIVVGVWNDARSLESTILHFVIRL